MVDKKRKAVAFWLLTGVFMIMVQILLGGLTRLTGSGLSITEWKPLLGAVPPLDEASWNTAFNNYKHIAQFKYLNSDFTLSQFKSIYFWEWLHREWARLLSVVFTIGFIYFLVRQFFDKKMIFPFIILFVLGGLQGAVGWIMVQSGLNDTDLYVNHIKLAIHFMAALLLLCYTLWFALQLLVPEEKRVANNRLHYFTMVTIIVLGIQLMYGAFMAGLKAAMSAPTWPDINGMYLPGQLNTKSLVNNPINVHFMHREIAYILFTLIMFWFGIAGSWYKRNRSSLLGKTRWWPFILVWLQVLLGILTVLNAPAQQYNKFGKLSAISTYAPNGGHVPFNISGSKLVRGKESSSKLGTLCLLVSLL